MKKKFPAALSQNKSDNQTDIFIASFFSKPENFLSGWSPLQVYPANTVIYQQDTPAKAVYLIESGLVKLSWLESGNHTALLGLRRKNWFLGAPSVILEETYKSTATTLTRCSLKYIPKEEFLRLVKTNMQFSWQVNQMLSREVCTHLKNVMVLGSMQAKDRLKHFLCKLILEESRTELERQTQLEFHLKSSELAQLIAITPEHLCRILKKMEKLCIIERHKGCLIIKDPLNFLCNAAFKDLGREPFKPLPHELFISK